MARLTEEEMHNRVLNKLELLNERFQNLEDKLHALEVDFFEYQEKAPKSNSQWVEERLRALEHKQSALEKQLESENIVMEREEEPSSWCKLYEFLRDRAAEMKETAMRAGFDITDEALNELIYVLTDAVESAALLRVNPHENLAFVNLLETWNDMKERF